MIEEKVVKMLVLWLVFCPMIGALIAYVLGRHNGKARDGFVIVLTILELVLSIVLAFIHSGGAFWQYDGFLVTGLSFEVNGFKAAYAVITALMWAGTTLFGPEYFHHEKEGLERYWMFILMTLGATEGVMLSGDLMTAFIFFEILSFTSFTWVIHEQTKDAVSAGYTYLFIAVIGGLVLFMGLALLYHETGTLSFTDLRPAADACENRRMIFAAGICILLGFGAKAGMFPLHVWLPKAHPVAPSPASALLSGVLTKVGIYGILMITLGRFFRQLKAHACLLLHVPDWIHPDRRRNADPSYGIGKRRGICDRPARSDAAHGKPLPDQTDTLHGCRCCSHEPA